MQEAVEKFIAKKKAEKAAREEKLEEKLLVEAGLFEKEYGDGAEYPYYDENSIDHYKKIPLILSDEEWDAVRPFLSDADAAQNVTSNSIATAVKTIAILTYIGGFFLGLMMGNTEVSHYSYYLDRYYTETEFSIAQAAIYWAAAFVSGTFTLALSEIVRLLHEINQK